METAFIQTARYNNNNNNSTNFDRFNIIRY